MSGRWSTALRTVVAVSALLTLAVLVPARSHAVREIHDEGEGLLSASSDGGGAVLEAPEGVTPWRGTFGGFVLCVTEPGVEVELQRVVRSYSVPGEGHRVAVREVPPTGTTPDDEGSREPVGSLFGLPPEFRARYADPDVALAGESTPGLDARIDQSCVDAAEYDNGYTELLMSLAAGPPGAQVTEFRIDYLVDGVEYGLRVEHQLTLCGTHPRLRALC